MVAVVSVGEKCQKHNILKYDTIHEHVTPCDSLKPSFSLTLSASVKTELIKSISLCSGLIELHPNPPLPQHSLFNLNVAPQPLQLLRTSIHGLINN